MQCDRGENVPLGHSPTLPPMIAGLEELLVVAAESAAARGWE